MSEFSFAQKTVSFCMLLMSQLMLFITLSVPALAEDYSQGDIGKQESRRQQGSQQMTVQSAAAQNVGSLATGGFSRASQRFSFLCSICPKFCANCTKAKQAANNAMIMAQATADAFRTRYAAGDFGQNSADTKNLSLDLNKINLDGNPNTNDGLNSEQLKALNKIDPKMAANLNSALKTLDQNGFKMNNGVITDKFGNTAQSAPLDDTDRAVFNDAMAEAAKERGYKTSIVNALKQGGATAENALADEFKAVEAPPVDANTKQTTIKKGDHRKPADVFSNNWWQHFMVAAATSTAEDKPPRLYLGSDPIGTSADDIFQMMNRSYLDLDRRSSFLPP